MVSSTAPKFRVGVKSVGRKRKAQSSAKKMRTASAAGGTEAAAESKASIMSMISLTLAFSSSLISAAKSFRGTAAAASAPARLAGKNVRRSITILLFVRASDDPDFYQEASPNILRPFPGRSGGSNPLTFTNLIPVTQLTRRFELYSVRFRAVVTQAQASLDLASGSKPSS